MGRLTMWGLEVDVIADCCRIVKGVYGDRIPKIQTSVLCYTFPKKPRLALPVAHHEGARQGRREEPTEGGYEVGVFNPVVAVLPSTSFQFLSSSTQDFTDEAISEVTLLPYSTWKRDSALSLAGTCPGSVHSGTAHVWAPSSVGRSTPGASTASLRRV